MLGAAVLLMTLGVAWVYFVERARGTPVDLPTAFLTQLPLTVPTLVLAPGIVWMARRFPIRSERLVSSLAAHACGLLAMVVLHGVLSAVGMWLLAPREIPGVTGFRRFLNLVSDLFYLETNGLPGIGLFWSLISGLFFVWVFIYLGLVGAVHARDYLRRSRSQERLADRLESRLVEAQLASLRGRLQPHFLFNTLQAVAGLVDADPAAARSVLARLGDLLRLSLKSSRRPFVSLGQEIDFVRGYLEIESARFDDGLTTAVDVPGELTEARVPSFVLQPLVENALRHGVSSSTLPGAVEVRARRAGEQLILAVRDDGGGEVPDPPSRWQEGIGLSSTRQRLEALYGDDHRMEIRLRDGGGVEVELRIPFEEQGEPDPPDG